MPLQTAIINQPSPVPLVWVYSTSTKKRTAHLTHQQPLRPPIGQSVRASHVKAATEPQTASDVAPNTTHDRALEPSPRPSIDAAISDPLSTALVTLMPPIQPRER
mmetsp:Transcript_10087/g.24466  ORF Transcript_10087/g.24466 Transcript_10087/m.24466 type:complete len:105 (+) Transcript_10087:1489-1803(+)